MLTHPRSRKTKNHLLALLVIVVFVIVVAIDYPVAGRQISEASTLKPVSPASVTVQMIDQDESGQNGVAVITDNGNNTSQVVLDVIGEPNATSEPASIYTGSCDLVGGNAYPLNDLVGGVSTSTIEVSMSELVGQQLPLAINVQDSSASQGTYATCGGIN